MTDCELLPTPLLEGNQVIVGLFSHLHLKGRKEVKKEDGVNEAGEGEKETVTTQRQKKKKQTEKKYDFFSLRE